mgnify:CR=1 FL=1
MVDIISLKPELLQLLPPETSAGIVTLITILKALGLIFIIYFSFQITNIILNIKRNKRIKIMERKINSIESKLDKLLKNKEKK